MKTFKCLVLTNTHTDFSNALHLEITPPEGGLRERGASLAMPEQLTALSHERVRDDSERFG